MSGEDIENVEGAEGQEEKSDPGVTEQDIEFLQQMKERAPGWTADQLIAAADKGLAAQRQQAEEEQKMWDEREKEKTSPKNDDDDDDDGDLLSRKEVERMLEERERKSRNESAHVMLAQTYAMSKDDAYMARKFAEAAMADPANKGVTVQDCYKVFVDRLGKTQAQDDKNKASIKRAAQASAATPPANTTGMGSEYPETVADQSPKWDDHNNPNWDLFNSQRLQKYKKELNVE